MVKMDKNVQPLRSKKEIEDMKWSLQKWCSKRDYFLFFFGINTGLRISDIVKLKVRHVRNKKKLRIKEQKTKKIREINLVSIAKEIQEYIKGMSDNDFLFSSRKGSSYITTTQAYRQLVKAGKMIDREDIGTHTMRKTFGYHYYKKTKDVAMLQEIFSHAAPSITKRYIGITQDEINESLRGFKL